jgi:hypothetical protein
VVPDPSLSFNHSYSSATPRVLHTFKEAPAARVPHPSGGSVLSTRPFNGGVSPSSSVVLSNKSAAPGTAYLGNSVLSFHSSSDGSSDATTPVVQYSCADMTDKVFGVSAADDELNTTTSGSYSVDPQDLCDEIDELFFKDMGV